MGNKSVSGSERHQYCLNLYYEWQRQAFENNPFNNNLMVFVKPPEPDASTAHEMTACHCRKHPNGGRPYPARLLHVSILWLGGYPQPPAQIIDQAAIAIETLQARPIKFAFDHTGLFGRGRHIAFAEHSANHDFNQFTWMLGRAFGLNNVPHLRRKRSAAHMTVIYDRKNTPAIPLEQPLVWTAREFMLVYSWRGQGRHEVFGRWRFNLQAAAYPKRPEQLPLNLGSQCIGVA